MVKIKRIILLVGLVIIIPGWLIITGLSLYCSVSLSCNVDASSWWSLFITVIGIPIVVFQLYSLRKTIEDSLLKPKAEIGILVHTQGNPKNDHQLSLGKDTTLPLSALDKFIVTLNESPELFALAQDDIPRLLFPIWIIIRNIGKKALRFVKISISLETYPGDASPVIGINKFQLLPDHKSLIFNFSFR